MKKTILSISIAVVAVVGGFFTVNSLNNDSSQTTHTYKLSNDFEPPVFKSNVVNNPAKKVNIDADYSDAVATMDELKKNSDLIVYGQVVAQEQYSEYAVVSTVKVSKSKKGKSFNNIKVFQLGTIGSDDILKPNKTTLLFLGKQVDDEPDTFFIKGGVQGLAEISNDTLNFKDEVIKKDFNKKFSKISSKDQLSSLDTWLN